MSDNMIKIQATTSCSFCSINDEMIADLTNRINTAMPNTVTEFSISSISINGQGIASVTIFVPNDASIETISTALSNSGFSEITADC